MAASQAIVLALLIVNVLSFNVGNKGKQEARSLGFVLTLADSAVGTSVVVGEEKRENDF